MASPEEMIKQCIYMLQVLNEDSTIPRNIRRAADETVKILTDEKKSISLRAASALSRIDEVSNDSNMPMHARTKIWEIVSALEAIPLN
ncbi:MAG TPA: UPF0147 family protein [Methanocorpusculum sp.]|nr:UPF0147 family protein [Methanocorpusculum sp.]